ncbi:hypothetical protein Tco_0949464 [Tanacetum coccineum]
MRMTGINHLVVPSELRRLNCHRNDDHLSDHLVFSLKVSFHSTLFYLQWQHLEAQQISESRHFVNWMLEEVETCRNQIAQLNALIAEMKAFDDPGEVFARLMGLRDDVRVEKANSLEQNLSNQIKEKESLLQTFTVLGVDYYIWCVCFEELDTYFTVGSLAKLSEVVESPHLVDKMKYVFSLSRGEDESFSGLMRDLCLSLRVLLSKKQRLVAELEAIGEVEGAVKCLEHIRVIVARNSVTLGELETLLGRAQVGVSLKAGFVADMDVKD